MSEAHPTGDVDRPDAASGADKAARTEAGYDSVAADYAARSSNRSPEAEAFARRFVSLLPASAVVIDAGCGPGEDLSRFTSEGHRPIGLDRSSKALALARSLAHTVPHGFPLIRADLRSLPFPEVSVDAVWAFASLLHVDTSQVAATLAEWERVLRPNGVVGFTTSLGGDSGWELAPAAKARMPTMPAGERRWFVHHTEHALANAMQLAGLEAVDMTVRSSHRDWLQVIARTRKSP